MLLIDENDAGFVAAFEAGRVGPADFPHRAHVRLTWTVLRLEPDPAAARRRIGGGILAFATRHGAAAKFHVTITDAWIRLVEAALAAAPPADRQAFDDWIAGAPHLLDARRLGRHYSPARLAGDAARTGWVPPDLAPLAAPPAPAPRASDATSASDDAGASAAVPPASDAERTSATAPASIVAGAPPR
ncbi:MAG: hypothetical protein R2752_16640 [Vicinamibacterales bacterium]